ncbi:hypothetical protein [Candidatus Enterococcus ferrettii]|nr:hypothetical protein [Enterococcus sp. 665A]
MEPTIDEEEVKIAVQTHFKETPDKKDEETISFEENSFSEWLGF